MSLQHLRTFAEVYRRRSISEAARVLRMTQPAVSQHVASLETLLGRPLFERHARGVRPTAVGDDLAASLGSTLDVAEAALATARARSMQLLGTVHIAGPADYMAERIAPRLTPLLEAGLSLRLHMGGKEALYAMLLEGGVDLAFTASRPDDARLSFAPIEQERMKAVASPAVAARIAAMPDLAQALVEVPHVAYDMDRPMVRLWMTANRLPPLTVLPAVTAPNLGVLRGLLQGGAGWSVLPDYIVREPLAAGQLAEIPAPVDRASNQFYLVWTRSALRHPRIVFAQDTLLRVLRAG